MNLNHIFPFFELMVGAQLIFWAINSKMNWIPLPENDKSFSKFVEACYELRWFMALIKGLQIGCSLLLISQTQTEFALLVLSPIIFVITWLQVFHAKNPWPVLLSISIPFFLAILPVLLKLSSLWVFFG